MLNSKLILFAISLATASAWAIDSTSDGASAQQITVELGKIQAQLQNAKVNQAAIEQEVAHVDALISSRNQPLGGPMLERIADVRSKADDALGVNVQNRMAKSVCSISGGLANPRFGNAATHTEFWEGTVKAAHASGDRGLGFYGENLMVAYAIQGHDNEAKISQTAKDLVKWCNSSDQEAARAKATGACQTYQQAASNPGLFIDSLQKNRQWIAQNQFVPKYNASVNKWLDSPGSDEGKNSAAEGDKTLADCAKQSPSGGSTTTASASPTSPTEVATVQQVAQ
jgi:hypothetical protein